MGTWGHGSFENDGALDWVAELESEGLEAIRGALEPRGGYVEVDDAQNAIAAAEVVAAARGHGAGELPEEVTAWIADNASKITGADAQQAHKAVTAMRKSSELQELWSEHGPDNDWTAATADLLARLDRCRA